MYFARFPLLIVNEGEICGVRNTERFDSKMSIKVPITFTNLISLDTSLILCGIRLDFKFKKQPFRDFRGPCDISRFFVKKLSFSVLSFFS